MDPKAAAKSKRLQSQQGKRNHPTPSAAVAHKKKEPPPQSKQPPHGGAQRSRRHHYQNLPSNWDRYGDDDSAVEAQEGGSDPVRGDAGEPAAKATRLLAGGGDAVAPKSRGADFGYLIEQARSQSRDRDYGDGGLASTSLYDETLPDFFQGLTSLVSVKGESLLSWCSNDNFMVDNDAGSSFEVPFLSMDVNALAAQLSKLNMAQRLFIEEDICSTNSDADRLHENKIQRSDHVETQSSSESKQCFVEGAFPCSENEQAASGQGKSSQSEAVDRHDHTQQIQGKGVSPLFSERRGVEQDLINSFESLEWESKRQNGEFGSGTDVYTMQDSSARFEATAAEAELDRLLYSFGATDDFVSTDLGSNNFTTNNVFGDHLAHTDAVSPKQESSSLSKVGVGVSLEDTLDEVLAEGKASCSPVTCEGLSKSSSTQLKPCYPSTDMDLVSSNPGFSDSQRIVPLEKSIDDLLAETSFFGSSGIDGQSSTLGRPPGSSVRVDAPCLRGDHDSRHASTISIDETIDDLLAETSLDLKNPQHAPHTQAKFYVSYDKPTSVSKPTSVPKVLEDFDTWLDSIDSVVDSSQ